jgi:hypothetical protein
VASAAPSSLLSEGGEIHGIDSGSMTTKSGSGGVVVGRGRVLAEVVQQVCNSGGGATCGGRWRVDVMACDRA